MFNHKREMNAIMEKSRETKNICCKKKRKICMTIVVLLFGYNLIISIYNLVTAEIPFMDFHSRWQENAYLCHGMNPFLINDSNYIEQIGRIDSDMATVPYAWLLGGVFNPGFLPYPIAVYVGVAWIGVAFAGASAVIYQYWITYFEQEYKVWALLAALLLGCQIYWWWGIACGNHGVIAACLIIMAICLYQKHPVISGILMTFAMIKPQLALPFFFIFLLEKEYRIIWISLAGGIASMLGTAMMAHSSVWDLVRMTFQTGSSWGNSFFGLFDVFRFVGMPVGIVLLCDMVVGVAYTYILWRLGKRRGNQTVFEKFSGVAIASTFWFYKQPHDNIILAVPCIAFLYLAYKGIDRKVYLYIFLIVAIVGSFYIQGFCQHLLPAGLVSEAMEISIGRTLQAVFLMVIGIIPLYNYRKGGSGI